MINFAFPASNAAAAALLSIFVFTRNRIHPANRLLAATLFSVFLFEVMVAVKLLRVDYPVEFYPGPPMLTILVVALATSVLFSILFGRDRTYEALRQNRFVLVCYGFATAAILVFLWRADLTVLTDGEAGSLNIIFSPSWRAFFAFAGLSMLLIILHMVFLHRRMKGIKKQVYQFAALAIASVAIFFFLESLMALVFVSLPVTLLNANSAVFMTYQLLFLFAIVRYRLLGSDVLAEQFFTYRIFVTSIAVAYVVLLALVGYFGWAAMGTLNVYLIAGIALALSAGAVAALASDRLGPDTGKGRRALPFQQPHKYEYRERWDSFTLLLSHIDDLDGLCRVILPEVMETMRVKKGTLWLLDEEQGRFTCYSAEGIDKPRQRVALAGRLVHALAGEAGPVTTEVMKGRIDPLEQTPFDALAADVYAPLRIKEKLIGFMTLGASWKDASRGFEDYRMLRTLAAQAALAIYRQLLAEKLATVRGLESLSRISSFVIHDLKNSVNMLSLVLQNATANIHKPEFQQDAIDTITRSTDKIRGLVDRLSFSPEMEKKEERSVLDINVAIDGVLSRLNLEEVPGVSVLREYGSILPIAVVPHMFEQLFENLFLNAVQALPGEGGTVSVRTTSNGRGLVVAEVSDTGCGIPQEDLERKIFKPLHTTKEKGLGIGLYHCRHIVASHGGTIEVESEVNKGSTFRVSLKATSPSR